MRDLPLRVSSELRVSVYRLRRARLPVRLRRLPVRVRLLVGLLVGGNASDKVRPRTSEQRLPQ